MNMEQVFETLKVQTPGTASKNINNSPMRSGNTMNYSNSFGSNNLRRSHTSTVSVATPMRKSNGNVERRKSGYVILSAANQQPQSASKNQLSTSPIDILFKVSQQQQGVNNSTASKRRVSSNKTGRENASPTNQRSSTASPNYAGPKFSEAPSPRSLPFPPLHWLQANNSPSVKVQS